MIDPTADIRRLLVAEINSYPTDREALEEIHGKDNVWDTGELTKGFVVHSFLAPFCSVTERSSGRRGIVEFQDSPRFYYDFKPA